MLNIKSASAPKFWVCEDNFSYHFKIIFLSPFEDSRGHFFKQVQMFPLNPNRKASKPESETAHKQKGKRVAGLSLTASVSGRAGRKE